MSSNVARSLVQTRGNKLRVTTETSVNLVHIDHCDLWLQSAAAVGVPHYRMAMILGLSPGGFSQAFAPHHADRNPPLKRMTLGAAGREAEDEEILRAITCEYAIRLAALLGVSIGDEYTALCRDFAEAGVALLRTRL
jgi:hypothetical protein